MPIPPGSRNGAPFIPVNESIQWLDGGASKFKMKVTKVVKAAGSNLFNAAATTDSANVFVQPALSILVSAFYVLNTQFAAPSLTDLDIEVGDGSDHNGLLAATGNLTSDDVGSKYSTRGAYFDATALPSGMLFSEAGRTWVAYAAATGANLNTLTAGQITFYFVTLES